MKVTHVQHYHLHLSWHVFWDVLHTLNRRAELVRLIVWAKQKRLPGPLKLYFSRLQEEEARLMRYRLRNPKLMTCARLMHVISNIVSPNPSFLQPGSASHYQYRSPKKRSRKKHNR